MAWPDALGVAASVDCHLVSVFEAQEIAPYRCARPNSVLGALNHRRVAFKVAEPLNAMADDLAALDDEVIN